MPNMNPSGFFGSIASKVLAGMMLVILTTIISTAMLTLIFRSFQKSFAEISNRKLPGLIGASRLIRETEQLIANAPDIIITKNQYILNSLSKDIKDKISHKETLLLPLREAGISENDIDLLSGQFDLVFGNLRTLIDITTRRSEAEYGSKQIFLRLYRISLNPVNIKIESDMERHRMFAKWSNALNQAVVKMFFMGNIYNDRELSIIRKEFDSLLAQINAMPVSEFGASAKSVQSEVIQYGTGENNIFELKQNQIALQKQIEDNLIENKFLSGELIKTTNRIFSEIQTDIIRQNHYFLQKIQQIFIMLIAIPIFGILSVSLIYLYLRKSVIGRILMLEKCMRDHVEGRPGQIPISGADEITDMAKSVDYFISEIQQREDKLKQAKEIAESANRAKSAFLASMSHELRTPLNGILGYVQILKKDPSLTPRQKNGLNVIEQSGEHLLSLINDVLDLAKVESGKIELYETEIYLPSFLRSVGDIINVRAEQKGIAFHADISDALPETVFTDERRLRQVILNLLGNAVKFTDKGTVTLRVIPTGNPSDHPCNPCQSVIRFEVQDTGIGISSKDLEKIFDPFQQAGNVKRRAEGTGLGLAISRNLVELMGGKLKAESRQGLDSKFWFDLELIEIKKEKYEKAEISSQITGIKDSSPMILIVDDNPGNRAVFRDLLLSVGFIIIEAEGGSEGLATAIDSQPDAVITDLIMPETDGFELIRRIRQHPELKDTVIIAASASVYEDDHRKSTEAGANAFLPKPVDADLLFEILQRLLNIEWEYKATSERPDSEKEPKIFILPPDEMLKTLLDLAEVGDVEEILNQLDSLVKSDETFSPFAEKFQKLAKGFKLNEIKRLIREYTDHVK